MCTVATEYVRENIWCRTKAVERWYADSVVWSVAMWEASRPCCEFVASLWWVESVDDEETHHHGLLSAVLVGDQTQQNSVETEVRTQRGRSAYYNNSIYSLLVCEALFPPYATQRITWQIPAMSLATSCVACVKLEHVLFLLRGVFSTLRCVRCVRNAAWKPGFTVTMHVRVRSQVRSSTMRPSVSRTLNWLISQMFVKY